jgi:hypothetical protein
VIPGAPASTATRAASTTDGDPDERRSGCAVRELRNVATLLTLTLSRTIEQLGTSGAEVTPA